MAYITFQPSDYFNTVLYTGNGSNDYAITGVGFQPDWVWIKARSQTYDHMIHDAVRGQYKNIRSNQTNAEDTDSSGVKSFDTDGFTTNNGGYTNGSGVTFASWNWKAGNSSGSSNSDGSITSTVSANTTAGFSIVKYTGTGSNATIGHGLGVAPKFILVKNLTDARSWGGYHASLGATKGIDLDGSGAAGTASSYWNDTAPTTSVFSIGTANNTGAAQTYIAYCFAEKKGFSKFGKYTGNANANGTFIYTGFKPAMIIIKNADANENWSIYDNKRLGYNPAHNRLYPSLSDAEVVETRLDTLSNGFKMRSGTVGHLNTSHTFIYMAFAEEPLVSSNNIPATAR